MKHSSQLRLSFLIIVLILSSLACKMLSPKESDTPAELPAAPTATSAPVSTETPPALDVPLGEEIRLSDQGFAFRPLPDYQLDTTFGAQMLAPDADPDTGPAFMLVGGAAFEGITAQSLINSLASDEVTVSAAQPITVNGYEGLVADIQRGTGELSGRVVAVMVTPVQQFVLFAMAPQLQWDSEVADQFDVVLTSVKLFEMETVSEPAPDATALPGAAELTEIRQWASSAAASSEYGSDSWAAYQATGAPNVAECSDSSDAWAAASSTTVEWLELSFEVPVEPSQVNVHISYNPIHIVKMELIDLDGISHQIYEFEARAPTPSARPFSASMSPKPASNLPNSRSPLTRRSPPVGSRSTRSSSLGSVMPA